MTSTLGSSGLNDLSDRQATHSKMRARLRLLRTPGSAHTAIDGLQWDTGYKGRALSEI